MWTKKPFIQRNFNTSSNSTLLITIRKQLSDSSSNLCFEWKYSHSLATRKENYLSLVSTFSDSLRVSSVIFETISVCDTFDLDVSIWALWKWMCHIGFIKTLVRKNWHLLNANIIAQFLLCIISLDPCQGILIRSQFFKITNNKHFCSRKHTIHLISAIA